MGDEETLHFSFGPVQAFVAQARRTRDFWAGSYLLSYLAGCAMVGLEACGGRVVFPDVNEDPVVGALRARGREGQPQAPDSPVGSLPNRFRARVPAGAGGSACTAALQAAWDRIAGAVFRYIGSPREVEDRWRAQVRSAWDCIWVVGEPGGLLDLRKNLRSHVPPPEPGDKCSLCGERQELSGLGLGDRESRAAMREWWDRLRRRLPGGAELDLPEGERLCAVCLVKRLFPRVAREALGWEVPQHFPSTYWVAAASWLEQAVTRAPAQAARLAETAVRAGVPRPEAETYLPALKRAVEQGASGDAALRQALGRLVQLDAKVFYAEELREGAEWPEAVVPHLGELRAALGQVARQVGHPSPFFALLVMDGDGMGALLGGTDPEHHPDISRALLRFSRQAAAAVEEHRGALVYAGGDDVVALLPVSHALACARACRQAYLDAFAPLVQAGVLAPARATISAAVVFAHVKTPLRQVIASGHRLLDEVAKDGVGRDALACRVWKRGGPILTWAQPWDAPGGGVEALRKMAAAVRGQAEGLPRLPSKFLYRVRELFPVLAGAAPEIREAVLVAELLGSRDLCWPARPGGGEWADGARREAVHGLVRDLLGVCQVWRRVVEEGGTPHLELAGLAPDGALLVRFLAQEAV